MFTIQKTIVTAAMLTVLSVGLAGCDRDVMDKNIANSETRPVLTDGVAGDLEVSNAVTKALQNKSELKQFMINVETRKGDITLKGEVDTEQQRMLAEQVALSAAGTHTVNNEIRVIQ